jgi:hypothetical protein
VTSLAPFTLDSVTVAALRSGAAQAQIDGWLASVAGSRAIVVDSAFVPLQVPSDVSLERVAAGCVCCVGHVVLRVQLTRVLRVKRPKHLLLLPASADHLDRIVAQLRDGSLGFRAARVHLDPEPDVPTP